MKIKLTSLFAIVSIGFFSGCTPHIPLEPKEVSEQAKMFKLPAKGKAGVYVYRDSFIGQAITKNIWIDNKCLGKSKNKVFFYQDVEGDMEHNISTQSEFSPNILSIKMASDKNYYIRQYIKMGVFIGGSNLELMDEKEAQKVISTLDMGKNGICE